MSKKMVIILVVVLLGGGITALVAYQGQFKPKYSWTENFTRNSDQPYGLKLFYEVLKEESKGASIKVSPRFSDLDTTVSNTSLVYVGYDFNVDEYDDVPAILSYVAKGNVVFISCHEAPLGLAKMFVPDTSTINGYNYSYRKKVQMDFTGAPVPFPGKMDFTYWAFKDSSDTYWAGYKRQYFTDTMTTYGFEPIASFNDSFVNCYEVKHGKGRFVFHTTPVMFTNYHMVRKEGFEHVNNMLSFLNDGPIYWSEYTMLSNFNHASAKGNPLAFLFSHYTLRWGWYLLLATLALFLLFRSKREQRIIPILPVNANTSVEFTKAIGTLYYQKGNHSHIATEMYTVFLADVRSRYYISTDIQEANLIDEIAVRSGVDKTFLVDLFSQFHHLRFSIQVTSKELIALYSTIEKYYKIRK